MYSCKHFTSNSSLKHLSTVFLHYHVLQTWSVSKAPEPYESTTATHTSGSHKLLVRRNVIFIITHAYYRVLMHLLHSGKPSTTVGRQLPLTNDLCSPTKGRFQIPSDFGLVKITGEAIRAVCTLSLTASFLLSDSVLSIGGNGTIASAASMPISVVPNDSQAFQRGFIRGCSAKSSCVSTSALSSPQSYMPPWLFAPITQSQAYRCELSVAVSS